MASGRGFTFGVSALVVGLTVVSFGTSAPELLVSFQAALNGNADISIGNVVGSNIANIGLILGIAALIYPVAVRASLLRREIPIMVAASFAVLLMIGDGEISRLDGIVLVASLLTFICWGQIGQWRGRSIWRDLQALANW